MVLTQLGMETRLSQQVPAMVVGGRTRDHFPGSLSLSVLAAASFASWADQEFVGVVVDMMGILEQLK
jgi:hypothetical protein